MFLDGTNVPLAYYDSIFVARLTSATLLSGRWTYGWVEMLIDPAGTGLVVADGGRQSSTLESFAYELNNASVAVDTLVWMRVRGIVNGGVLAYEFDASAGGVSAQFLALMTGACIKRLRYTGAYPIAPGDPIGTLTLDQLIAIIHAESSYYLGAEFRVVPLPYGAISAPFCATPATACCPDEGSGSGSGCFVPTDCCLGRPTRCELCLTVTDGGDLDDSYELVAPDGATSTDWQTEIGACPVVLECTPAGWLLTVDGTDYLAVSAACSPFRLTFETVDLTGCGGDAGASIAIVEGTCSEAGGCCDIFNSYSSLCVALSSDTCPCLDGQQFTLLRGFGSPADGCPSTTIFQSPGLIGQTQCGEQGVPGCFEQNVISVFGRCNDDISPGACNAKIEVATCKSGFPPTAGSIISTIVPLTIVSCNPLVLVADVDVTSVNLTTTCTGTVQFVVTAPPCPGSSGSGTGSGTCCDGACGDPGVPASVTATVTGKMGCFTICPDVVPMPCVNGVGGTHVFDSGSFQYCSAFNPITTVTEWQINCGLTSPGGNGTPRLYMIVPPFTLVGFDPEPGWTCSPFSAEYFVNDGAGNQAVVVVVG